MDSDDSSASAVPAATPPPAGKVCRCPCGSRISSLTHDYHSFCINCRGQDCDVDNKCEECVVVADDVFTVYVKHRQSLKRKLVSKQRRKLALSTQTVTVGVEVRPASVADFSSPSPPSVALEAPVSDVQLDAQPVESVQGVTLDQGKDLFAIFSQFLEAKFASIDSRISQGLASKNVSQDVLIIPSFTAPSVVAGRSESTPDRAPLRAIYRWLGIQPRRAGCYSVTFGQFFPFPSVV